MNGSSLPRRCAAAVVAALLLAGVLGCAKEGAASGGGAKSPGTAGSTIPDRFALPSEPAGAQPVKAARANAKSGDEVVVSGRVSSTGADRAFFTLVDSSVKSCAEMSDPCPEPWDYCCEPADELARASATVELRDADKAVAGNVLGFHGIDHLTTVVVRGKAEKDSAGNLTIVASGIFVKK